MKFPSQARPSRRYYNLHTESVEDYVGGLPDMEEGVLRTPLPAAKTFADDPLRVLRAVRFAARSRERSRGTQPVSG